MPLSQLRRARFARHLTLPDIGEAGQERLATARVLIVGVGGLGCPTACYLTAAGVGTIGLMDDDRVELSNLQRQVLHYTADLHVLKVDSAARKLNALNPDAIIRTMPERLRSDNASSILADYDFVIDASDGFASKYLIANACHEANKPCCHAGIAEWSGQAITVIPRKTACYRCLFEVPPNTESAEPAGPVGALPGVLGSIQALEAIKFFLGKGQLLTNRILVFDALSMSSRVVTVRRNPSCQLCGSSGS